MSEIAKSIRIIEQHLGGNILDLGSNGMPCVPWAVQIDVHRFHKSPNPPVQLVLDAFGQLPFKDHFFDAVVASHILEDTKEWVAVLLEWCRVIKIGGHIIIQVPDAVRYRSAVASGQPDNKAHQHESFPGELTEYFKSISSWQVCFQILADRFEPPDDYNILFIAQKIK